MTSDDEAPVLFPALPGRTVDRSAAYVALLRDLLDLVGAEAPAADEIGAPDTWHHLARQTIGTVVTSRANEASEADPVPEEWFEPLMRAAVHEPNPSFNRQLVEPALAAFGRRRVQLALLAYLDTGTTADMAGAARAWYWTKVLVEYRAGSATAMPESSAEHEAPGDLRERYVHTALRRFVGTDDLDVRRCILPGLPLNPAGYPAELHDLVAEAVRIARTSGDDYLQHRVEIQVKIRQ